MVQVKAQSQEPQFDWKSVQKKKMLLNSLCLTAFIQSDRIDDFLSKKNWQKNMRQIQTCKTNGKMFQKTYSCNCSKRLEHYTFG